MRDSNLKIPDIKVFRSLTRLLGKLGIHACREENSMYHAQVASGYPDPDNKHPRYTYGFGLRETKDLVERTFDYRHVPNSPLDKLVMGNELHQIKRTRQFMNMLNKLGLKTPDAGLQACRGFITRRRR